MPAPPRWVVTVRSPCALAASSTRSTRPRSREAVSGFSFHSGLRTERTSSVVIVSTGNRRSGAAYSRNVISHWATCLPLRQDGRMAAITRSAHWPNVALSNGLLASLGFMPSASLARAC